MRLRLTSLPLALLALTGAAALAASVSPVQPVPSRVASVAVPAPLDPLSIDQSRRIAVTPQREALTLDYIRQHYDPAATSLRFTPRMIVVHWTATRDLGRTLDGFRSETLSGRADLGAQGGLNTGAQYLVDRDGHIFQLFDDTLVVRHTIGLNRAAIGIENMGSGSLTPAQLSANERLVAELARRYPTIGYLIGHFEYGRFRGSALWEERDPRYFTVKVDPGQPFMTALRARLKADGLSFRAAP